MILFAILAGFYAIGLVGYYKLSVNISASNDETRAAMSAYPVIYRGLLGLLSLVWPVMMYWQLVKEAAK